MIHTISLANHGSECVVNWEGIFLVRGGDQMRLASLNSSLGTRPALTGSRGNEYDAGNPARLRTEYVWTENMV